MKVSKPTSKQTWVGVAIVGLPIIASILGVEYGQKNPPAQIETTTNVAITALPAGMIRSDQDIKILCEEVIKAAMDFHINKSRRH